MPMQGLTEVEAFEMYGEEKAVFPGTWLNGPSDISEAIFHEEFEDLVLEDQGIYTYPIHSNPIQL